jgi:hypothetical protein
MTKEEAIEHIKTLHRMFLDWGKTAICVHCVKSTISLSDYR